MQTRSLRTLVRLSEVGGFAKAADQLGMTLSALSMQIKALEAELGVQLFDRSARPPRLTPIGRAIVAQARPMLAAEDRLKDICQPSTALVGRFRLGFVTSAAVRLLPGLLERAQRDEPRAQFEFETGLSRTLQDKVVHGALDAAVVTDADGLPSALSARTLRNEPLAYTAHASLLDNGLPGLLARHSFFHFMPDTGIGKLIAVEIAKHDRPAQSQTIVLDNLETIMECVAKGLGFALLPEADIARYRAPDVETLCAPGLPNRALILVATSRGTVAGRLEPLAQLLMPQMDMATSC